MGGGASIPADKHVVIVGGGYAGTTLARQLKKCGAKYTIIDPKDVFYENTSAVRSLVEAGFAQKTCIPFKPTFGDSFKQAKVTAIDTSAKSVTLDTGETVNYDYLVIATGSGGPYPFKMFTNASEFVSDMERLRNELLESKNVVVVGGGAAGVEVAGELATDMPDLKVTLVHSSETLCSAQLNHKFQRRVKEIMTGLGIELMLGEKVSNLDDLELNKKGNYKVQLASGKELDADVVLKCTGLFPETSAFKDTFGQVMDDKGAFKVNDCLQVEGFSDVFAIGDCNNVDEPKMAILAGNQGEYVMDVLSNVTNNKKLSPYKLDNKPVIMIVSVGRNNGVGQFKNAYTTPEFMVRGLKSKNLFYGKFWKDFGQTPPQ